MGWLAYLHFACISVCYHILKDVSDYKFQPEWDMKKLLEATDPVLWVPYKATIVYYGQW